MREVPVPIAAKLSLNVTRPILPLPPYFLISMNQDKETILDVYIN